ncbi:hypothetical protein [Novipirellula galeiformis]|uniref:hypothetical protein n=1 Tax=Novipirellula galeiformis TaxID=2528004 RepID=UPI0011B4D72F|nr:hypothetical protein [Novipirellula galeiformis]
MQLNCFAKTTSIQQSQPPVWSEPDRDRHRKRKPHAAWTRFRLRMLWRKRVTGRRGSSRIVAAALSGHAPSPPLRSRETVVAARRGRQWESAPERQI